MDNIWLSKFETHEHYNNRWYVFFAKSGEERDALPMIRHSFDNMPARPFIPTIEMPFKKHGEVRYEIRLMFPGYVFMETDMPNDEFVVLANTCARRSGHILKLLRYGDEYEETALRDVERKALETLWGNGDCHIAMSFGTLQDKKLVVTKGPLMGMESNVRKIDRHCMTATVQLEMFGEIHMTVFGLAFF
jgi:transcriptional antiterminator NusG